MTIKSDGFFALNRNERMKGAMLLFYINDTLNYLSVSERNSYTYKKTEGIMQHIYENLIHYSKFFLAKWFIIIVNTMLIFGLIFTSN